MPARARLANSGRLGAKIQSSSPPPRALAVAIPCGELHDVADAARPWYDSPSGPFQPQFYRNSVTGEVNYELGYKSFLHSKRKFPNGGV